MRKIITLIVLWLLSCVAYCGEYMILPIISVHDGDTINTRVSENRLPHPLSILTVRLVGIDTPEMPAESYRTTGKLGKADCVKEAELALEAKEALTKFIGSASVMRVYEYEWDKYGGRILGKVVVNQQDLSLYMLAKGYAVAYYGKGEKKDWCL